MTTGQKTCEACGKAAVTFACGSFYEGQESRTHDGRFHFCQACNGAEWRKARQARKAQG